MAFFRRPGAELVPSGARNQVKKSSNSSDLWKTPTLRTGYDWLLNPKCPGKMRLYDGRTEPFLVALALGQGWGLSTTHTREARPTEGTVETDLHRGKPTKGTVGTDLHRGKTQGLVDIEGPPSHYGLFAMHAGCLQPCGEPHSVVRAIVVSNKPADRKEHCRRKGTGQPFEQQLRRSPP